MFCFLASLIYLKVNIWTVNTNALPQAFSLVLGSVAENVAAGLNVILQYISHLLQTAGIQGIYLSIYYRRVLGPPMGGGQWEVELFSSHT